MGSKILNSFFGGKGKGLANKPEGNGQMSASKTANGPKVTNGDFEKKNLSLVIDERYENEQKQVIKIMQDQIQDKIKEMQAKTKELDEMTMAFVETKHKLANEREINEELKFQVEIL